MKIKTKYEFEPCCGPMERLVDSNRVHITEDEEEMRVEIYGLDSDGCGVDFCPFCGAEIDWEPQD